MSASIPAEPVRREEDRLVGSTGEHPLPSAGQVADQPIGLPALDAALEVRHVAGEPQQLELERKRDRIERSTATRARRNRIHGGEEPRQRLEGALVALLFDEEPQHRLGTDESDRQAVRVLARGPVCVDERDAGDRVELAGSLVEHQLDVRERLEPRAEARLRLSHALRHRADAAALGRVQMEHAVGLAEAERPQHDGLGLVRAAHAGSGAQCRPGRLQGARGGSAGRTRYRVHRHASW